MRDDLAEFSPWTPPDRLASKREALEMELASRQEAGTLSDAEEAVIVSGISDLKAWEEGTDGE